jgi:hypothetical protein
MRRGSLGQEIGREPQQLDRVIATCEPCEADYAGEPALLTISSLACTRKAYGPVLYINELGVKVDPRAS